jgi:purine-nucleoside phosphorylase
MQRPAETPVRSASDHLLDDPWIGGADDSAERVAAWITARWSTAPVAAIVLGTGLGSFVEEVEVEVALDYDAIPHFQPTSALGHQGRLLCGRIRSLPVAVLQGRLHAYEGHPPSALTLPVRVVRAMGARLLLLTNASGGLNPRYRPGDVLVIDDHINLLGGNPLLGLCGSSSAGRSAPQPYDPTLVERAIELARQANFTAHRGVYVGMTGPNYETRAEYRFLRRIGGDAVGMSTIPEALAAAREGMRVLALSAITNLGLPDAPQRTRGDDVCASAANCERKLRRLMLGILADEAQRLGLTSNSLSLDGRGPG